MLASPVIFYQAWRFVSPGLYLKERKLFLVFAAWSTFGFLAGMTFAYFVAIPAVLSFFLSFGRSVVVPMPSMRESLSIVLRLLMIFGVMFELPLVLFLAGRGGILTPEFLRKWRKGRPRGVSWPRADTADAVSQIMVAFPLYALFEIGIVLCALGARRRASTLPEPPLESGENCLSSGRSATSRNTVFRRIGMIIECQTCHARFRLDDSRIKGRGARVKCRKCGESIVVLKDGAPPPPPAPGGDGFFDLGSAVRDSAGEHPGFPPPAGNLIPFPAPARPVEPIAVESSSAAVDAAVPEKDEVDLAFDRVLFPATEGSFPSIRGAEAEVKVERYAAVDPEPRPEMDLGALNLDLEPEEKLDLTPAEKLDLPPAVEPEPPLGEPPAEFRGEGGFLISDSDTLDFLQEKHRETGSEAPPASATSPWRSRSRRSRRGVPSCVNRRPPRRARIRRP